MDHDALFVLHQFAARNGPIPAQTTVSYNASHIVLSFFTSWLGCITTLELLQRRTSTRGAYNWFLLFAAAITMGGIGIWGMHFVGNRAIVLANGNPERQILYNQGFTALSFFMPIMVLLFAFYYLGMPTRARQLHVAFAGVLTGAAVCGMHYLGQLGVDNYSCSYRVQNVVGAAIIAVVASFTALSVFFRLRDSWTDSWWKRALCGGILAIAVSGMHWTAAAGTIYHWKGDLSSHGDSIGQTAIIAAALSMGSCVILLVVAFIRGRNKRTARIKAQRLVLACAYFDEGGRLMVTQEGILPSQKITNHYVEKTFGEDELSRSHATFLWIFKASRNWAVLRGLIPGMKEYIETDPTASRYRPGNTYPGVAEDPSDHSINFAPIFKQLFCVAAQQLANLIHEPLERMGSLFEEPLETGVIESSTKTKKAFRSRLPKPYSSSDPESGTSSPQTITRGKYLFLHRQITKYEVAKFAALGYRFATVGQIADPLAKSMLVNRDNMLARIERMRLSASPQHLLPPGVHLACFVLRPSMYKSFDVLVQAAVQNRLPYATMQSDDLSQVQMEQLQSFDEWTVSEILRSLVNQSSAAQTGDDVRWQLYNAFVKLVDVIGDYDTMMQAKFSAKAFHIPCQASDTSNLSPTCTMFTVRVMRNIHSSSIKKELTYVPLSFFGAQQQVEAQERDELFERKVGAEFDHARQDRPTKQLAASGSKLSRKSSSAGSTLQGLESPRSALFRNTMGRILPIPRRSDEATIVEPEKSIFSEDLDIEMGRTGSYESGSPLRKPSQVTQTDITDLGLAGNEHGHWVSEVFGLFRLGAEGWASVRQGGWKWDISVENTFEVGPKERRNSGHDTDSALFLGPS